MKTYSYLLLLVCVACSFLSCKDDDNTTPIIEESAGEQILRIFVDGELNTSEKISTSLETESKYGETERTFTLNSEVSGYTFEISVDNWSWQGLPTAGPKIKNYYPSDENRRECYYDDNSNLMCEIAKVHYFNSTFDTFYTTPLYSFSDNVVGITRNDRGSVDGWFDVTCLTTNDDTVHLEGSFNNIKY